MTKKQMVLLGAVALVGVYLCFFVDWFAMEHDFQGPPVVTARFF